MAQATVKAKPSAEAPRELPEINPRSVTLNDAGQRWRTVEVRLPEGMVADDLRDPKVWAKVQGSRESALIKLDNLLILAFDESFAVRAIVTHADSKVAHLAIEKVFTFREQGLSLWSDGTLQVYWDGKGYGVRRASDGVRVVTEGYSTEALAADAARRWYATTRAA